MLQNKDIAKTQEVKTFFKDTWRQPEFFIKHLELLNFSISSHKRTGKNIGKKTHH